MILSCSARCRFFLEYSANLSRYLQIRRRNFSTNNDGCDSNTENVDDSPASRAKAKIKAIRDIPDSKIRKSVFISQSNDIFTNLALEEWLLRKSDFIMHHVLMLWQNDPCVVIGRHQNPFSEANVDRLEKNGIVLARRKSGGGTVYHDRGNINLTFFTPNARHDRKYNLNIITRALFREWGIKAEISERDDITLDGNKISGTAAHIVEHNAYHHCTLLVHSDKKSLRNALIKDDVEITSRATTSVRSPVKNLVDVNRHVNVEQLQSAIGHEFLRTSATELVDHGRELLMKQRGFQMINPTEQWFPGITEIRSELASWDFRIGKTPMFTALKSVQLKSNGKDLDCQLKIIVDGGIINEVTLIVPNCSESMPVISSYRGKPYSEDNLANIAAALNGVCIDSVNNALDHSL